MFWRRKPSPNADAYVRRIHQIMMFASTLAGQGKTQVTRALRDDLGIKIEDATQSEERTWSDTTIADLAVSFSLDFKNPTLISQIQITGYGVIDGLMVCANCLEMSDPRKVNFTVDVLQKTRPSPALAQMVAENLTRHSDFECLPMGDTTMLLQRNRNK